MDKLGFGRQCSLRPGVPSFQSALRVLAEALPEGSVVPVPREALLVLLNGQLAGNPAGQGRAGPAVDATVRVVAGEFSRSPSTIREWCEAGLFPGAYKMRGREWRIPAAAIEAFQEHERSASSPRGPRIPTRQRREKVRHLTRLLGKPA
jgi:hypothetical protein